MRFGALVVGVAVVLTAYALYQASEHARDTEVLQNELTRARAAVNHSRPNFLPSSKELQAALTRIETEQASAIRRSERTAEAPARILVARLSGTAPSND